MREGEKLARGDRVRFEVEPGGLPYLLIAGIDGAGQADIYVPYQGSESLAVDPVRRFLSPGSIELDEARGPERVFALASRKPLSAASVVAALKALGANGPAAIRATDTLPLAPEAEADAQSSFLWEKGD